ncbi:MAG: ATP-binding protein [Verrucomicrobiota bacterium]
MRLIFWVACFTYCLNAAEPDALTTCQQVLRLSPSEANEGHEVKLKGVITCYVPGSQLCFMQDQSAGIYVYPTPWPKDLGPGDVVEVTGVTGSGLFSPIVQIASIKVIGKGELPSPKKISIEQLNSGAFDSQYVEVTGTVQSQENRRDHSYLELWTGGSSGQILFFTTTALPDYIGRTVTLSGVGGTFYYQQKLTGFGLFAQLDSQMTPLTPVNDPFATPIHDISKLLWYSASGPLDHRIHIKGTVLHAPATNEFLIKDESGTILIQTDKNESLIPGEQVEASGFLRNPISNKWLAHTLVKKTGSRFPVAPTPATLKQLQSGTWNDQFVSIKGTVAAISKNAQAGSDLVVSDGDLFQAVQLSEPPVNDLLGSKVEVQGMLALLPAGRQVLRAGAAANLKVLQPRPKPSAYSSQGSGVPPLLLTALFALPIIPLLWALHFRRRVEQTKTQFAELRRKLEEQKFQLEHLAESRERLGRDLHDHIIQSIYAVGLNVEDCAQLLDREPAKVEGRLKSAMLDINSVIRELRNVILGLESNAIQPQEFRTALKSLALTLGQENSNKVRLDLDQAAMESLSPGQATELIHIAREAMSNSLRHGAASKTVISMRLIDGHIRFEVQDDGTGFNQDAVKGKGFGLRNMAKRSHDLGAVFSISSEFGKGTRIVLDIPTQKQHFSPRESHSRFNS